MIKPTKIYPCFYKVKTFKIKVKKFIVIKLIPEIY